MSAFLFMNRIELSNLLEFKKNRNIPTTCGDVTKNIIEGNINFDNITLNRETGTSGRSFNGKIRVSRNKTYQSVLILSYFNDAGQQRQNDDDDGNEYIVFPQFPNRVRPYRNHFCVYTGLDDSVLIVRSETTLRYEDHDAVLQYELLKLSNDSLLTATCRKRWIISYDSCLSTSTKRPDDFLNYTLCCSGEWWYFDTGVVLNGIHGKSSCLIYYEPYDKYELVRRIKPSAFTVQQLPFFGNGGDGDTVKEPASQRRQLPKFAQLISERDYDDVADTDVASANVPSVNDTTVINAVDDSDFVTKLLPKPRLENLLPSLWWFAERDRELYKGNITYFIPL